MTMCPFGAPLQISNSPRPFLCGDMPGKPVCPPMYTCHVDMKQEYGVCCPVKINLERTGFCPVDVNQTDSCTTIGCYHDLECPGYQKCCNSKLCGGNMCMLPHGISACLNDQLIVEMLSISERQGRGYIPQCTQGEKYVYLRINAFASADCERSIEHTRIGMRVAC